MKNFTVMLALLSMAQYVNAQAISGPVGANNQPAPVSSTPQTFNNTQSATSGGGSGGESSPSSSGSIPAVPNLPTAAPPTSSIQQQAQEAQKANQKENGLGNMAMGISAGIAAANSCGCMCPHGSAQCPMFFAGLAGIVISMMIAGSASDAGNGAGVTVGQLTAPSITNPDGTTTTPTTTTALTPQNVQALEDLKAQGVSIDKNGNVSLPNGQTLSGAALAAGDLSGTGLSAEGQASAKGALAGILKDAKAANDKKDGSSSVAFDSGGGGDGSGGAGGAGGGWAATPNDPTGKDGKGRGLASVKGLKKVLDGGRDAIGVASDDLFLMVNNRYRATGTTGGFVAK